MSKNSPLKLFVSISSPNIVGSNVSINDNIIKKSIAYNFNTVLGNSNDLDKKILSVQSFFSTFIGDTKMISSKTKVIYKLKDNEKTKEYEGTMVKINDEMFVVYLILKLVL